MFAWDGRPSVSSLCINKWSDQAGVVVILTVII